MKVLMLLSLCFFYIYLQSLTFLESFAFMTFFISFGTFFLLNSRKQNLIIILSLLISTNIVYFYYQKILKSSWMISEYAEILWASMTKIQRIKIQSYHHCCGFENVFEASKSCTSLSTPCEKFIKSDIKRVIRRDVSVLLVSILLQLFLFLFVLNTRNR